MSPINALQVRPPAAVLRRIAPDDRDDLPVTYIVGAEGKPIQLSRYESNVWDFSPYIHNKNTSSFFINFDFKLSDGISLIDAAEYNLLHAVKSFLYTRWLAKSPRSSKHIKAATLTSCWSNLKPLLREGANKRGNSSRLTQSFHFFMFEPIFSPVNASNQPI